MLVVQGEGEGPGEEDETMRRQSKMSFHRDRDITEHNMTSERNAEG